MLKKLLFFIIITKYFLNENYVTEYFMNGIVIARYNEDISWIDQIDLTKIKVYLYNKGTKITNIRNGIYYEEIPNFGRESDTYLYHIIKNYHKLEDKIIFTQANFKDHIRNLDELLNIFVNCTWYQDDYNLLKDFRLDYWCGELEKEKDNLTFGQWMKKYVSTRNTSLFFWSIGAIMCISKKNILSRKLQYYRHTLRPQLQSLNPEVGHYFERAWFYIFNLHK